MTPASSWSDSRSKSIMAELRQMSLVSQREEGLLNHAQAAIVLEVSTRRIGELVELGKLARFDFLGRTYVSVREIMDRRTADLKAGRPKRTGRKRFKAAAKLLSNYDLLNVGVDVVTPEPKKRKK